jgi:PAS domain S-box-containing protein
LIETASPDLNGETSALSPETELFLAALQALPVAAAITDIRGIVRFANVALTSLTGYTNEEVVGQSVSLLSFGDADHSFSHLLREVISTGKPWVGEWFWRRKTGNLITSEQTVSPIQSPNGKILYVMLTIQDVTERNQIEEELRLARGRLEALEKTAGVGVWGWDCATSRIEGSSEWLKLHGLNLQTSIINWETFGAILHPEDRAHVISGFVEGFQNRESRLSIEYRVVLPDGEIRWIIASGCSACEDPGGPVKMIGVCLDATERKRVDLLAAETKRDFERFFNLIPDLACIVSTDGYFKKVNPAWETTLGYAQEEVLKTPMLEFIHPEDLERTVNEAAKQSRDYRTKHFVNRYRCKDGSYRLFDWTTTFNRDESTRFGVATDITEQRLWEESLRESEERFRIMADSCPTIIWVSGADGRIRMTNRTCREFFGTTLEQTPEGDQLQFLIHPDDQPEYADKFLLAVRERAPFRAEARIRRSDGEWRWIVSYAEPRRSISGDFLGHVGISPDITDRKQSEVALQKAKEAAEIANRSKSEFLANMSHEIRTPMNGVIGLTDLALGTELTPEQREYLHGVKMSAESLLRILNDILDFSKIEAGKLEFEAIEFDLRQTVGAVLKVLGTRAAAKNLKLTCDFGPEVPSRLIGDPGRLQQILVNLTGNAIKFTERGEVMINVDQSSQTEHEIQLHFSVRDTGIGIPPDKQQHVFTAFAQADTSSTRKFGGTGLGLSISSQLIEMMDGRIWLESEEGRGSTFHFTVRLGLVVNDNDANRPVTAIAVPHATGPRLAIESGLRLNVLVVEDNPVNSVVATRLLIKQHHTVRTASDGREALEIIEKEKFDCVLMDVQMPVLDGFETTAAIRRKERDSGGHLPIIAMTAHAMAGDLERCLLAGMDGYLTKPIKADDVFATIERVLRTLNSQSVEAATRQAAETTATNTFWFRP